MFSLFSRLKMLLHKIFTLCVIVHSSSSASLQEENAILTRALRDITGQYHPELHGDHAYQHGSGIPSTLGVPLIPPSTGYYFPPPPPPPVVVHPDMPGPNGYANCGCWPKGRCPPEVVIGMAQLLRELKNDVVCGIKDYDLCCVNDPWAGPIVSLL